MNEVYQRVSQGISLTLCNEDVSRVIQGLILLTEQKQIESLMKDPSYMNDDVWSEYHYCQALCDDVKYIQSLYAEK